MGRRLIVFVGLLFVMPACFAGRDTSLQVHVEKIIPGSYTGFYTDNLGDVYLVSGGNQVKKLNASLDSETVFNDVRRYGALYSIDVSNPLKIVVYYRDFTTIVVLDRFLKIVNTIDLRKYGILQAGAVAASYDNNYWVFDEVDNGLKKIDDNGNILFKSSDFRVLFNTAYAPSFMKDENGRLYLFDEKSGWMIFDYYGTFKQHVETQGRASVGIANDFIITRDSAALYYYDTKNFSETTVFVPGIDLKDVTKLAVVSNRIYVLTTDRLTVYRINP